MAVVAFPNLAPQGHAPEMEWQLRTISARQMSPMNGVATTLERAGAHWSVRLPYETLAEDRRGRLQSFVASTRGYANRFYVPVYGWTRRGSFPATELLTNSAFNGTTGWSAQSSTIAASDGVLRVTPNASGTNPGAFQNVAVAANTPYAMRGLQLNSGFPYASPRVFTQDPGGSPSIFGNTGYGMSTAVLVPGTAGNAPSFCGYISDSSGYLPAHYLRIGYSSMARCALVDNGPCFTQRSQEIDNAYWTKTRCTATANAHTAPNRTATADSVIEDNSNNTHFVARTETRTSAAADWFVSGYFSLSAGTRNLGLVVGRDASNYARAIFQLSGSGTIASAAAVTGDATNPRAFITALGGGWYYCAVGARLTATTGLYLQMDIVSGTTLSYAGDSTSGFGVWQFGAAQTYFPTRGMLTTSAGDADGTLQTGSTLYLRGLPVSTADLLMQGDPVEIITNTTSQLVRVKAALNSDAAGMGVLEFEPPLRVSPLDGAAVIIHNPLCRMMLDTPTPGWRDRLGGFSDLEFSAVEDTYPS